MKNPTILLLAGFLLLAACRIPKPKDPQFAGPGYTKAAITSLTIVHLVDLRQDKSKDGNFNKWVQRSAQAILKRKKYVVAVDSSASITRSLIPEHFTKAYQTNDYTEIIAPLKAAAAEWVLLLTLDEVKNKVTIRCKATAEMTGYLFNTKTSQLVMKHKGSGEDIEGMVLCELAKQIAVELATSEIIFTFPKK